MNARTEPGVRRLMARRRLCRMAMRKAGLLALAGYTPPSGADVQSTWRKYGWVPANRVAVVTVEIRSAA